MNNDLRKILQKLEKKGDSGGINITFDEKGISGVKGKDGYTPVKGVDYFTDQEIRKIIEIVKEMATPVKGKDYYTSSEVAQMIRGIESRIKLPKDGKDGRDGVDGKDGETPDARAVAIDAVTLLESFEGDARLSATALKDFEIALDEALKNPEFKIALSAEQITGIKDLLPKYPPMNAGGSGATFLKSLRDVDLSGLTKNLDGKYVLGGGSGSATFLDLTDTPADYTGQAGKVVAVNVGEDALEFIAASGVGTVTSVAVSGSDGIEVDSGSPITAAGTIAIGLNKATTLTFLNVEDGADVTDTTNVTAAGALMDSEVTNLAAVKAFDPTDYAAALGADDNYVTDAEKAALHPAVTVTDSTEIDFTLTGQDITASLKAASIDETKLDTSVNASLDLADSALQSAAIGVTVQGYDSATTKLGNTTTGTGSIVLNGSPALTTPSIAAITVSGGILTLPTGATSNLVSRVSTDTLTNKTVALGSNTVSGTKAQFDTAVTDGNFMYVGDAPTAHTHLLAAGATDVTASAAEVNILDGATLTVTELNYVDGVTSAIQGQIDALPTASSTTTFTNKRVTKRTGTTTSSATPTINTDTVDEYYITAQTEAITSFTTNLSGTPTEGQTLFISIVGTAARAVTFGASFGNGPVALPTTTVTTTQLSTLFKWSSAASKWLCYATGSTA